MSLPDKLRMSSKHVSFSTNMPTDDHGINHDNSSPSVDYDSDLNHHQDEINWSNSNYNKTNNNRNNNYNNNRPQPTSRPPPKTLECHICTGNHFARDCEYFHYENILRNGDSQLKKRGAQIYLMHSQKQPDKYRKPMNHIPPPEPSPKSAYSSDAKQAQLDKEISMMSYNEIYSILNQPNSADDDKDAPPMDSEDH